MCESVFGLIDQRQEIQSIQMDNSDSERISSNSFHDNLDRELELLSERTLKTKEYDKSLFENITIDVNREREAKEAMSLYLTQSTISFRNTTNQQEESSRIRNSFSGVHHSSVKTLPSILKPGSITESRRTNANNNINTIVDSSHQSRKTVTTDGLFSPLKYKSSEYKKEITDQRESERLKRIHGLSFSRKPFTYTSSPQRLKNEDLFGNETYSFPAPDPGQGQIDLKDCVRTDFVNGSKFLYGPFAVSGKRSGESEVSRDEGVHWCAAIYNKIKEDWSHLRFSIKYSSSDEIIISFDVEMLLNEKGEVQDSALCRYMTQMTAHGLAADFRLKKRGDRWRVIEDIEVITKSSRNVENNTQQQEQEEDEEEEKEKDDDENNVIVSSKEVLVFVYVAPWRRDMSLKVRRGVAIDERKQARQVVLKKIRTNRKKCHGDESSSVDNAADF